MSKQEQETKISHLSETILGVLGGIIGIGSSIITLLIGGVGQAFKAEGAQSVVGLSWLAMLLSLAGLIAGAMSSRKPSGAGIVMVICGIGGFFAISLGYILAGPLLIIGGILALRKGQ